MPTSVTTPRKNELRIVGSTSETALATTATSAPTRDSRSPLPLSSIMLAGRFNARSQDVLAEVGQRLLAEPGGQVGRQPGAQPAEQRGHRR